MQPAPQVRVADADLAPGVLDHEQIFRVIPRRAPAGGSSQEARFEGLLAPFVDLDDERRGTRADARRARRARAPTTSPRRRRTPAPTSATPARIRSISSGASRRRHDPMLAALSSRTSCFSRSSVGFPSSLCSAIARRIPSSISTPSVAKSDSKPAHGLEGEVLVADERPVRVRVAEGARRCGRSAARAGSPGRSVPLVLGEVADLVLERRQVVAEEQRLVEEVREVVRPAEPRDAARERRRDGGRARSTWASKRDASHSLEKTAIGSFSSGRDLAQRGWR